MWLSGGNTYNVRASITILNSTYVIQNNVNTSIMENKMNAYIIQNDTNQVSYKVPLLTIPHQLYDP